MDISYEDVINQNVLDLIRDDATCEICQFLVQDALQCKECQHCWCRKCIESWKAKSNRCPNGCVNFELIAARQIKNILSKIMISCKFKCGGVFPYDQIQMHVNHCELNSQVICPYCNSSVKMYQIQGIATLQEKIGELEKQNAEMQAQIEILKKEEMCRNLTVFPNGERYYITTQDDALITLSSQYPLPENFNVRIKFLKLEYPDFCVIGVSGTILDVDGKYLGGQLEGTWGIAGNGQIGEEGYWVQTKWRYKECDVLEIRCNGTIVSFSINNEASGYAYDMKKTMLYLSLSHCYKGDILLLI